MTAIVRHKIKKRKVEMKKKKVEKIIMSECRPSSAVFKARGKVFGIELRLFRLKKWYRFAIRRTLYRDPLGTRSLHLLSSLAELHSLCRHFQDRGSNMGANLFDQDMDQSYYWIWTMDEYP